MNLFVDDVRIMFCFDNVSREAGSMPLYIFHFRAYTVFTACENFSPNVIIN